MTRQTLPEIVRHSRAILVVDTTRRFSSPVFERHQGESVVEFADRMRQAIIDLHEKPNS